MAELVTIWIDADSCAVSAREVLEKASLTRNIRLVYVANRTLPSLVEGAQVETIVQRDADAWLLAHVGAGDLCITRDIPLAQRLVFHGSAVMNDKGKVATVAGLEKRARAGNWNRLLSQAGAVRDKRPVYSQADRHQFAISLDKWLTQRN